MSIKYNEHGEVLAVNGLVVGQHLGSATQDALGSELENSPYFVEESTVSRVENTIIDNLPSDNDPIIEPLEVTENGTYTVPDGVDGYSPVTVNISTGGGEEEVNTLDAFIDGTLTELTSNAESVRNAAFYRASMETINLPKAKSLGQYSFHYAEAKTVNCPNVETINSITFNYCKITSISMPKLKVVSQEAFNHAGSLVSVDLPMVEELKSNAFSSCSKLAYLDFPCVKKIGSVALASCPLLSVVILRNTSQVCSLYQTSVFQNTPFASGKAGGKLLIPRALVDGYENDTNWSAILAGNVNNKYLALEDYTVDGTITGAIDWDKLNAA